MNKPMLGLLLGGFLGIFDGLSAMFTHPEDPEVRAGILGIIMMGTFKGLIAGIIMGIVARKVDSLPAGILVGTLVGLVLAYPVALMVGQYFWEIMIPGGLVGTAVGFATQKYGAPRKIPATG